MIVAGQQREDLHKRKRMEKNRCRKKLRLTEIQVYSVTLKEGKKRLSNGFNYQLYKVSNIPDITFQK